MMKTGQTWLSLFLPLVLIALVSGAATSSGTLQWTARDLAFIQSTLQDHYPYLEMKGVRFTGWDPGDSLQDEPHAQGGLGDDSDEADVRRRVMRLLKTLRDGHVYLEVRGRRVFPFTPPRRRDRGAFDPQNLPKHLGASLRPLGDGNVLFTRTAGNVGYILIRSFGGENVGREVGRALRELRHTVGLILDVRNNGGGSAAASNPVIARFISEPLEKPPVFHLGDRILFPPLAPVIPAYTSPVVVLVNGVCFSEAERFAEIMRQLPQVVLVGDTTGGGSAGGGDRFPLPNGAVLSFGTYDYRRYDGTPWEEEGIPPDLVVPQSTVHTVAGVDAQLEVALSLLG